MRRFFNDSGKFYKWGLSILAVYLGVALILGIIWSFEPEDFDVLEKARQEADVATPELVAGVVTTSALIGVVETLLDKPGGYLSNDMTPPGIWLDNIPNWEYGALIQIRDLSKSMREAFSRSQSQSTEDKALALAESRLNFDSNSWLLPPTEKEYREGAGFLRDYLTRLVDEDHSNAQFYARSDNLHYWLSSVETRLGSLSQRLSASVGQRRINVDLANVEVAKQSTSSPSELNVKTPWRDIDDVFYEARGSAWALIHFLRAMEVDFAEVLEKKNARVSVQQIIRELEGTQQTLYSPMILNGSGFGMLANHSLVMASYISRANAAIIDLRELLERG
ncbi:DUF2333 family protein [Agaribacterium haliotis]|uniref:DUF2333 family protein n=1 Tax=Agaribacterium haliotis TaxID=2013869 RepID=UPI0039C87919